MAMFQVLAIYIYIERDYIKTTQGFPNCLKKSTTICEVDGDLWGPIHLHLAARLGRLEELQQVRTPRLGTVMIYP